MKELLRPSYNWLAFFLFALIIRLIFVNLEWLPYLALMISAYQFSLLFDSIGHIIPTRHLLGSFMCLQFFVGSAFAYAGLDEYQYFKYQMRISATDYYLYAIPAVVAFIIGLHSTAGKYKGEIVNEERIKLFVEKNQKLPYIFIALGFFASVLSGFFSSELAFVFYLLGSFKFIGLFLLVLGTKQIKVLPMVIVIGSIVASSFNSGMFHDLLTWIIFTAAVYGIKYRFDFKIKMIGLSIFVSLALIIQILKGTFRETSKSQAEGSGIETFAKVYQEKSDEGGVFNFNSLATSNVRINQGFIITNIMTTVPDIVPFAHGDELYIILQSAIMPRILAPNKLNAGDRSIFAKYSHIPVAPGTSMGLSSLGDAYINFGILGGVIFMFFYGLLFSEVLNIFYKNSFEYPVLILFVPLVFYYPIRPDCELQTILGHLFKSCFLIFVMIEVWRYKFRVDHFQTLKNNVKALSQK